MTKTPKKRPARRPALPSELYVSDVVCTGEDGIQWYDAYRSLEDLRKLEKLDGVTPEERARVFVYVGRIGLESLVAAKVDLILQKVEALASSGKTVGMSNSQDAPRPRSHLTQEEFDAACSVAALSGAGDSAADVVRALLTFLGVEPPATSEDRAAGRPGDP